MSKKNTICKKCHKPITSVPKILDGKPYHTSCRELILKDYWKK